MSSIATEVVNKFVDIQSQIWSAVTDKVKEASKKDISFTDPLTVVTQAADMATEISAPAIVVQFALDELGDHPQVVLLPQETALMLASVIKNEDVEEIDDSVIADLKNTLESIVHGICESVGALKGETLVASGLSVKFQIFTVPSNLASDDFIRSQVAIDAEGQNGAAIWLADSDSIQQILPPAVEAETTEADSPFQQAPLTLEQTPHKTRPEDGGGLDILMDIPLEISVELGRTRMLVKDVVELGTGSIVEIDKAAGEPVDVMVNGRLVARGEVVVIEDNFGVRVTEILNPTERLGKLGEAA